MKHPLRIVGVMRPHEVITGERGPFSATDVVATAGKVYAKDPVLSRQLKQVKTELPQTRQDFTALPPAMQKRLFSVSRELNKAKTVAEAERTLGRLAKEHPGVSPELDEAFEVTKRIVAAGKKTTYDPSNAYYEFTSGGDKSVAKDQAKGTFSSDAAGALVGGIKGARGGVGGAFAGAAAAAVAASATAVIKTVIYKIIGTDDVKLFEDINKKYPCHV